MYLPTNRRQSVVIGTALVVIGVLLIPDVLIPTFTDWINLLIGRILVDLLGVDLITGVMISFIAGFALVLVGALILPFNTKIWIKSRVQNGLAFILAHPIRTAVIIVALVLFYYLVPPILEPYYLQMKEAAMTLAGS